MANTKSAQKRVKQTLTRTARNIAQKSRIRTMIRKAEEAIDKGTKAEASAALRIAQKELMQGVTKGVWHINTASRKIARLSLRVNNISNPL